MKKILLSIGVILVILAGIFLYKRIAPTKIGFINYPDFLYTKVATSNENNFIKVKNLRPDSIPDNIDKYDMLIIFGMGINLPIEQEQKIKKAGEKGVNIFLQASTNSNLQLTNIVGKELDELSAYLDNGGTKNYKNLLNYIRVKIDHKTFKTDSIIAPKEIPSDVLFYTDEDAVFEKIEDFENYCKKTSLHKEGQEKVILFTSIPGPFNANREHINSLIQELQNRNLNVYPIAGFGGRLSYMQQIKPSLIVYMPHGRLSMGGGSAKKIENELKKLNVPVLCPVSVFQTYDKWLKDKMGMFGGILSQSVTMPEFDGGIVPYATFAEFKNEDGLLIFKAIPKRIKKFGDIAENYLNLTKKKNADKKIAIVYFKGPGKNAMVAANMEVLSSLHNNLLMLKKNGYNLGNLPEDYKTFEKQVMKQGPVLGPYAEGAFQKFLETGNPELITTKNYEQWCNETLPTDLYKEVENKYGKAPGSYMAVYKDTNEYIAVARVKYGNVVLLPQPLPGIGNDEFALIHGAKVAPPHTYIAPYLWIQKGFKADAIFHFGTHGSLEFTPGKQIALSDYDWTDPLIGTLPHFYVYTISNVGEGMIAKRRSYAVTQTYLTPPFIEAQAFAGRNIMHQKIHKYEQATGALKTQYALSVKELAVKEGIHKDLGLDSVLTQVYTPEEMMKLANYLEEIEHDKITGGLYTMGVPYSSEKIIETVRLMLVDALAYNLAEIDIQNGKIKRKQIENKMFFNNGYTHPCEKYINQVLQGKNPETIFKNLLRKKDIERAEKWKNRNKSMHGMRRGMGGMQQKEKAKFDKTLPATYAEKEKVRELMIKIIPNEEQLAFVEKWKSEAEYEKISALLEPETLDQVKKMAKFIPAMKKSLDIALQPTVNQLMVLNQKKELYNLTINYLSNNKLEKEVAEEKHKQDSILLSQAIGENNFKNTKISIESINKMQLSEAETFRKSIDFYIKNKDKITILLEKTTNKREQQLNDFISKQLGEIDKVSSKRVTQLENTEETFANAVFAVRNTLASINKKREELENSPLSEFMAILNSLNGGYTPPSEGGDPIANPTTIPTGRNLVSINAEQTPTKEAWKVGKKLGEQLLSDFKKKHNKYPEKISFTLWSGSFIESEGTTIAQILYMLGVEPVWGSFGQVKDIRLIPMEELKRPRIDVLVQTSGQLRDLAASRLFLINKAISKVAAEGNANKDNFVSKGADDAEKRLIEKGFSPKKARELSTKRVFGGVNGNYGTGIMGMVESSDRWDSTKAVAQTYIKNMGAVYGDENNWGEFDAGVFEAALLNTEAVVQPRQSNTWGALSLDHVYEFMGGLNLAIKEVTGNDAESYFNDFRNSSNPRIQGLHEAIWVETRTTLLNPRYIKEYMKGGASSAETFAETFRNTFGWNVMKPSVIENRLWDELYKTYVEDEKNLGIHKFFEKENPYALQEMTAVMLETIRKEMWKATPEQIKNIAKLHGKLVKDYEAGCSGFVCDNQKLKDFISKQLNPELKEAYQQEIQQVREVKKDKSKDNVVLKKDEKIKAKEQGKPLFKTDKTVFILGIGAVLLLLLIFVLRRRKK